MNRRTRTLVVVGVAVLLASAAAFGVLQVLQNRPVVVQELAERHLVVAAVEIKGGAMITPDMVRLAAWPADAVVPGSFGTIEEVVNRGAIDSLLPNEPVTESKLAALGTGAGLPPLIPPGMRAMAVRVNDVIGVAGWTVPNTRVDVIVTVSASGNRESISRAVISNIQVLSVGANLDSAAAQQGQNIPASVVTLLVTPSDAEKLALAQNQGQIVLSLRNPLDVEEVETKGVRMSGLMGEPDPPPVRVGSGRPRMVTPVAPAPPPPYTVETIRGDKREQVIIKKGEGDSNK